MKKKNVYLNIYSKMKDRCQMNKKNDSKGKNKMIRGIRFGNLYLRSKLQ